MSALVLTTADGVRLAARWWHPREMASRGEAVVLVHGFCSTKDSPEVELVALRQAAEGRRVLTFDLRGHGLSEGTTTLGFLERLDVDAAVDAARADHDVVVVVGASMGGVATIDHLAAAAPDGAGAALRSVEVEGVWPPDDTSEVLASTSVPDGARADSAVVDHGATDTAVTAATDTALVDDGPTATAVTDTAVADGGVVIGTPAHWRVPRSVRGVLAVALTQTRTGRVVAARRMGTRVAVRPGRGAPPVERLAAVTRPVAVLHGLADRFVSPAAARALFDAVPEPRLLDLVPGMGHGFCAAAVDPVDVAVGWVVDEVARERRDASQRGRA